jgi:very-short-patch-repair endonuclease
VSLELDLGAIVDDYLNHHMSAGKIAEKYKTYPNKILRTLRKAGINVKDRAEVQKEALETGQRAHPMKGKKHKKESKKKIGQKVMETYDGFSDDKKKEIEEIHRIRWNERTAESIIDMRTKGTQAIRKSSVEGSKLEKYLFENLQGRGFAVYMHQNITENQKLEVDLIINKVAVEVQGPSHYDPIYGQDKLMKNKQADLEKLNLLLQYGYSVIYIRNTCKRKSEVYYSGILKMLLETYEEVKGMNTHKEIQYG